MMKRLITKYSWNQSQFIFTIFNQDFLQLLLRSVKCWFSRRWMRPRSSSADQETSWVSAEKEQLNSRRCGGSWCSWNIWGSRGLKIKSKNNPKQAGGCRLPRKSSSHKSYSFISSPWQNECHPGEYHTREQQQPSLSNFHTHHRKKISQNIESTFDSPHDEKSESEKRSFKKARQTQAVSWWNKQVVLWLLFFFVRQAGEMDE